MQSAGMRSEEMAEHDYFAHYSPVSGVWPNKMVRDQGYALPSSWSDDTNYIESLAAGDWYDQAAVPLDALIVDQGLAAATHRRHLLGADGFYAANREIGVGHATNPDSTYSNYWSVHIARQENASVFLTGVAFADRSGNGRYDMGEGLPGVTVQAGGLVTTSNDAGGFSIALSPNRQYRVLASGPGLSAPVTTNVYLADANVEVDIVSGVSGAYLDFADEPTSAWTNPRHRLDVSGNQIVDPVDALQIINHLNTIGAGPLSLPDASAQVQPPFLDTDADGQVLPHDVLLVINDLNRPSNSGEGEGMPASRTCCRSRRTVRRQACRRRTCRMPSARSGLPESVMMLVRPLASRPFFRLPPTNVRSATRGRADSPAATRHWTSCRRNSPPGG